VIYSADGFDRNGWAVMMAGGSLPNIKIADIELSEAIATMRPQLALDTTTTQWTLANEKTGYIIYDTAETLRLDLRHATGSFEENWVSMKEGKIKRSGRTIKAGRLLSVDKPDQTGWVLWLKKKK
jgi:hypothetical protein